MAHERGGEVELFILRRAVDQKGLGQSAELFSVLRGFSRPAE